MSAPKKLSSIADLTPDDRNLNVHTERGMGLLAKSLEQFGAGRSIVVDKHGKVIAGNATLEAAADKGLGVQVVTSDGKTLVVVQRTDLELETPQGRGLALADNRVAEVDLAWDPAQLKALAEEGLDVNAFFLPDELARILEKAESPGLTDPDEVPKPPKATVTRKGDLWILGEHRLLCGDSTCEADVKRVAPDGWDCAVIDPPFEFTDLPHLTDPSVVFVGTLALARKIPETLYRFERVLDKGVGHNMPGTGLRMRHAFVIQVGSKKMVPYNDYSKGSKGSKGARKVYPSIVAWNPWGMDDDQRSGAQDAEQRHRKPVWLLVEHLTVWMPPWERAFDPFAGVGSTIIAAQTLGRSCLAIELDPARCDVAVKRWEAFSGEAAKRA